MCDDELTILGLWNHNCFSGSCPVFVKLELPSVAVILNVAVPSPSLVAASLTPIVSFGVSAWSAVITLVSSNCTLSTLDPTATCSILTISLRSLGSHFVTIALLLLTPVVPAIARPGTNS